MTEITRVPLRPIAKGSLTKLWLGVAVAILLAGCLAWAALPKGVDIETLAEGTGPVPGPNDVVFVKYVGKLKNGQEFGRSQPVPTQIQSLIPEGMPVLMSESDGLVPGFRESLQTVHKGGRYVWTIPADQAYGKTPPPGANIPPDSDLVFDVEITDIMSREDAERRFAVLQQMMQQAQKNAQAQPGAAAPRDPNGPQ